MADPVFTPVDHDPFEDTGASGVVSAFGLRPNALTNQQFVDRAVRLQLPGAAYGPVYPASVTPYEPTLRDRLGTLLTGDQRVSPERSHFVEGLVGSRGLGSIGAAIADVTPLGAMFGVQEAARTGDPQRAAMAMLPGGGAAKGVLKGAEATIERVAPKIVAYHGTPHDFDQFDIGKLGTGEGNQSFGHGLYFAESQGVAKSYKPADWVATQIKGSVHSAQNGQWWATQWSPSTGTTGFSPKFKSKTELDDWIAKNPGGGHLYQVEIDAHPNHFLDWDKPLSEQSAYIQSKFPGVNPKTTGQQLHDYLGRMVPADEDVPQGKANWLANRGIPGIRFLDQGSRQAGEGTSNYVLFDHANVNITHKNGVKVTPVDHDPFAD